MVIVLTSIETVFIDVISGDTILTIVFVFGMLIKTIGLYICIIDKPSSLKNMSKKSLRRSKFKSYAVLIILSLSTVLRIHITNKVIVEYSVTASLLALLTQISIFLFANIAYRKEQLCLSRKLFKDYAPQIITTVFSDMLFYTVVAGGVTKTINYQIIILISLMFIEKRFKLCKINWIGILLLSFSIIVNYIA